MATASRASTEMTILFVCVLVASIGCDHCCCCRFSWCVSFVSVHSGPPKYYLFAFASIEFAQVLRAIRFHMTAIFINVRRYKTSQPKSSCRRYAREAVENGKKDLTFGKHDENDGKKQQTNNKNNIYLLMNRIAIILRFRYVHDALFSDDEGK